MDGQECPSYRTLMTMTAPASKGFALEEDRGVLVVTLYWESIVKDRALEELRAAVVDQLPQATTAVLFDCRKLTGAVTSQFLSTLVAIRKAAMREGLFVCVSNLSGQVREAYTVSRLERIIPLYDDRETAIRAVGDYGIGRIAVGKLEPERLGAIAEKPAAERGPSAAAALSGQASAAMASAADSWSGMKQNLHSASQSMSRQQLLQLGGLAAAAIVAVGLACYFLIPPRAVGAASITDERPLVFGGEAVATFAGQVEIQAGEFRQPDAGAIVIAWRAGETPAQKVLGKTIYRYLNDSFASEKFPHDGMHVARTSETGHFRLGVQKAGEYNVLVVSSMNDRGAAVAGADETQLALAFESPRELIGKHPYRLVQHRADKGEVKVDVAFERRGR